VVLLGHVKVGLRPNRLRNLWRLFRRRKNGRVALPILMGRIVMLAALFAKCEYIWLNPSNCHLANGEEKTGQEAIVEPPC